MEVVTETKFEPRMSLHGVVRKATEPRKEGTPMSVLYSAFFEQGVARVKGTLVRFNEDFFPNLPFDKESIAKEMCVFVDWSGQKTEFNLLGLPQHGRSLSFNVTFSDKYGNQYNYVQVKGVGVPKSSEIGEVVRAPLGGLAEEGVHGIEDYLAAKIDWEMGNLFLASGIQTSAPIAIIKLESVIMSNGDSASIEGLMRCGQMPRTLHYFDEKERTELIPVIYLVGFSEMMRVSDLYSGDLERFAKDRGASVHDYCTWFAENVAKNVAKMHNLGKVHTYLTDHNIAIDAHIVDHDGVQDKTANTVAEDVDIALLTVANFYRKAASPEWRSDVEEGAAIFLKTYIENRRNLATKELAAIVDKTGHIGIAYQLKIFNSIDISAIT